MMTMLASLCPHVRSGEADAVTLTCNVFGSPSAYTVPEADLLRPPNITSPGRGGRAARAWSMRGWPAWRRARRGGRGDMHPDLAASTSAIALAEGEGSTLVAIPVEFADDGRAQDL